MPDGSLRLRDRETAVTTTEINDTENRDRETALTTNEIHGKPLDQRLQSNSYRDPLSQTLQQCPVVSPVVIDHRKPTQRLKQRPPEVQLRDPVSIATESLHR